MSADRKELLERFLAFEKPLEPILAELRTFPFDCDVPFVAVEPAHIIAALRRYAADKLTAEEIESWADRLEMHDDVDASSVREVIWELANPLLTAPLTVKRAEELIRELQTLVT
jgi:hypothetical protein